MKKKLLILYSKNPEEVYNRKSALGSYIHTLSNLLEENFDVSINGEKSRRINSGSENNNLNNGSLRFVKSIIPEIIKHIIQDAKLFYLLDKLYERLNNEEYDLILEFYSYASNVGLKISKSQQIPLYTIYDGPLVEEYKFFNGHNPFFINKVTSRQVESLKQSNGIIVYSNPVKDYLIKEFNIENKFLIHQNIDFSRFEFLENKKNDKIINICFIGSFLKWHRVDLLVSVFNRIRSNNDKVKLFLIGSGQELNNIEKIVESSDYSSDIIITGYKDGEELKELKQKMHIGVMPSSNWYGAPNKIFEYGASNMAVVAPDTPTVKYIFKNVISLFENNSEPELYEKLNQLCKHKNTIKEESEVLNSFIKNNYSEEKTFMFYSNLFE